MAQVVLQVLVQTQELLVLVVKVAMVAIELVV